MAINTSSLLGDTALLRQAEQLCEQRLKKDPDDRAALRSLGDVCRKLGKLAEARAAYESLFRLAPPDREAGYLQAMLGGQEWPAAPEGTRAAPFALFKDFLDPDFHDALVPTLVSLREKFVPMPGGNGAYQSADRQGLDLPGKWEGKQRFRDCLARVLVGAIARLHVPPFELGPVEVCVRAYQDGHFFKIHKDTSESELYAKRVVNYVYYFHKQPRPYTGGELLLFDSDVEADTFAKTRFTRIVPEDNCLIFFPGNYYHSVTRICCPSKDFADSRFVINGHVRRQ